MEAAMGGPLRLARLTGCRAHRRCTGPQIRKMHQTRPQVYEATERVSLVSSFMASLLVGGYACIDETDGAGMNIMDIDTRQLRQDALQAMAPDLEERIGRLATSTCCCWKDSPLFCSEFSSSCIVIQWSGDNPNSLAGWRSGRQAAGHDVWDSHFIEHHAGEPRVAVIPGLPSVSRRTAGCGLVAAAVQNSGRREVEWVAEHAEGIGRLVLYIKALVRRRLASRLKRLGVWKGSGAAPRLTALITMEEVKDFTTRNMRFSHHFQIRCSPTCIVGFHRYVVKNFTSGPLGEMVEEVDKFDPPSEVRAIIEGQFMSMRGHSEQCGLPVPPKRIIATDSASLGAALRAAHGWLCKQQDEFVPFSCVYSGRLDGTSLSMKLAVPFGDCEGDTELLNNYTLLVKKRLEIEQKLIARFGGSE
ncbi:unnamed protein product [Miscanthus lutarioriparius]|uniref:Uncharacterized protein n=1 Tax=Miscanthus lutarioriparius TaxID=422564 RepID=A0A811RHY3_9POAL|nr:unnamed protein product [Miscanthus lutarioriparius]